MTLVPRRLQSHPQPCLTPTLAIQHWQPKIIPVLVSIVLHKVQEMCGIQSLPLLISWLMFLFVVLSLIHSFILLLVLVPHSLAEHRMTTAFCVQLLVDRTLLQWPWGKVAHISSL